MVFDKHHNFLKIYSRLKIYEHFLQIFLEFEWCLCVDGCGSDIPTFGIYIKK